MKTVNFRPGMNDITTSKRMSWISKNDDTALMISQMSSIALYCRRKRRSE